MTARTLALVNGPHDAGPPRPNVDVVVLDTSWVPEPGGRADLRPVRETIARIVAEANLFDESLARLDEWAAAVGLPDRVVDDGATWWFHARGFIRLTVHELLLWRHVLGELAPPGRYAAVEVPVGRPALLAAARAVAAAGGPDVHVVGHVVIPPDSRRGRALRAIRRRLREVLRRVVPRLRRRQALVDARVAALARDPGAVLAIVRAQSFHLVGGPNDGLRGDPYVGPVVERLEAEGQRVVVVALGLGLWRRADWQLIERSPNLIPFAAAARRRPPTRRDRAAAEALVAAVAGLGPAVVAVDGADLAPAIRDTVVRVRGWFGVQRDAMASARRLIEDLRPAALVTGWEAARTSWLVAARRHAVPIVAIQHGVIYPNTPDYVRPNHPALVRPDLTCVYGPYERDLLVEHGAYAPSTVLVTGSPRTTPDGALAAATPDERDAVRGELGTRPGERLLVVSTARSTVGDAIHSMAMAARLLGGPLPGIHVVFKVHPEETDGSHYERLLDGLARLGGYEPPRMRSVRDMDVYRLLRAADAHLGQYSTVLTDAVLTATPNMVAVGQAWEDIIGYVEAGVAAPVRSVAEVRAFMADPRPVDPTARERFLAAHYLPGDAVGRVADAIRGIARR